MGNLRDELIKKGLVSEKQAQQTAHEEKARKNRLSSAVVAQEKAQHEAEQRARNEARRAIDRERERGRRAQQQTKEARAQLIQLIKDNARTEGISGARRFFFKSRKNKLPCLELSEEAALQLEQGLAAIVEIPDSNPHKFVVVSVETARRVAERSREWIRFWNETPE